MKDWEISEKKTANNYGRKTPASGSKSSKLDIIGEGIYAGLRCENKFTEKSSRSISVFELEKTFKQAMQHLCEWFFLIDFSHKLRVVVVSESHFQGLYEVLDQQKTEIEELKAEIQKMKNGNLN